MYFFYSWTNFPSPIFFMIESGISSVFYLSLYFLDTDNLSFPTTWIFWNGLFSWGHYSFSFILFTTWIFWNGLFFSEMDSSAGDTILFLSYCFFLMKWTLQLGTLYFFFYIVFLSNEMLYHLHQWIFYLCFFICWFQCSFSTIIFVQMPPLCAWNTKITMFFNSFFFNF